MESEARSYASSFDWEKTARETLFLMQEILKAKVKQG
jgi:hypothetical protein